MWPNPLATATALLPLLLLATPSSTAQDVLPQPPCGVMPARYGDRGTVCCPEGHERYGDGMYGSACRAGPDRCALWGNALLPRCATVTTTTPSPTGRPTAHRNVSSAYADLGKGSCRGADLGKGIFTRFQLDREIDGSVHECQAMCDSQISCIAFEYSKVNAICEIHRTPMATVNRNAASQCYSLDIGASCNVHRDCVGDSKFVPLCYLPNARVDVHWERGAATVSCALHTVLDARRPPSHSPKYVLNYL